MLGTAVRLMDVVSSLGVQRDGACVEAGRDHLGDEERRDQAGSEVQKNRAGGATVSSWS